MLAPLWSVLLTAIFAATGGYSLLRLTRPSLPATGQAVVEFNHVVMSAAMVVMIWWPAGRAGTTVQIIVFALFATVFVVRLTAPVARLGRIGSGAHTAMNLAMVWMLAAMPILMSHAAGSGAATATMPGMDPGGTAATLSGQTWARIVNWLAVALMVAVASGWTVRAIRIDRDRPHLCCHAAMGAGMALMLTVMA